MLKKIVGERGTGKTKELLNLAKDSGGVVVCSNPFSMRKKAEGYGIVGIDIVSYEDYTVLPLEDKKVYIDDIDKYIMFVHPSICGFTISED